MAITDLASLKAAVSDWMVGHLFTPENLTLFVANAEADLSRNLQAKQMERTTVATLEGASISLPADCIEPLHVTLLTNPRRPLQSITVDRADIEAERLRGSLPRFYDVVGNVLSVVPAPSGSMQVQLVYRQRIPALTDAAPSNWLLTLAPDLYLYATLAVAAGWAKASDEAAQYRQEALRIGAELGLLAKRASFGRGPMIARTSVRFG